MNLRMRFISFGWAIACFSGLATAQVPVAFDPCRPEPGEQTADNDDTSLCSDEVRNVGIIVRGASADTHQEVAEVLAFDNLLTLNDRRLEAVRQDLLATGRYEDLSIETKVGLVEVTLVEKPVIARVEFVGHSALSDQELRTLAPIPLGSTLNENLILAYGSDILAEYQKLGYFSASIEPFAQPLKSYRYGNGLLISYEIVEGNITPLRPARFIGNEALSDDEIKGLIASDRWRSTDDIDMEQLSADQNSILQAYGDAGLGSTSVSIRIVTYDDEGVEISGNKTPASVGLVFEIVERRLDIGAVNLINEDPSNQAIANRLNAEDVRNLDLLEPGDVFNPDIALEKSKELSNSLNTSSEVGVGVRPEFEVDETTGLLNINFVIFEVPKRELISVRFVGNEQTRPGYMLRLMRLKVGDFVGRKDVEEALSRLGSSGLFEDISLNEDEAPADKIALIITVVESKTGRQRLGATYSTRSGYSIRMGVDERNWLGRGLTAGTNLTVGEDTQTIKFSLSPPPFKLTDDIKLNNNVSFEITRRDDDDYRNNILSWTSQYSRTLGSGLTETPSLKLSSSTYSHVGENATDTIQAEDDLIKTEVSLGYGLSRNKLRSSDLPLHGSLNRISTTFTFPDKEDNHARFTTENSLYRSLDQAERAVFSIRTSLDHAEALGSGELPSGARISNPSVKVRGFESGGFAPREVVNRSTYGGTTAFGSSISLRYKILNHPRLPIYGSIYIDSGTIFDGGSNFSYDNNGTDVEVYDSNMLRLSSGVGLILQTDAGAITFTQSEIHRSADFDKIEEIQFSFGANL